jgi:hypothetical protein
MLIRICRLVIMTRFKSRNIPMALMIASMRRFALLALTLLVIIPLPAWPQDCVPAPGTSSLLRTSEAVFVGIVTGASSDGTYHLQVTEAIKGVTGDNFEVETVPGTSFSSFQVGKQYLVFAYTLALKNSTEYRLARGCGLTRELKYAQAALEQVRAEKSGRTIASVYGTLLRTVPESLKWDDNYERPLSGIVVRLQSGQKSYMTQTDEYGVYAFTHLPPGTYQVSADLPPALTLGDSITENSPRPFELPRRSSFDYELYALPTGQIRGLVAGPDGRPLTITSVELYRADLFALDRQGLAASQIDGRPFRFFHLPPGDYLVVFNRRDFTSPDAPFQRTFHPDAATAQAATTIHLSDGQQISNANIRVKDPIPTRQITVRLHWSGRTPADYYPPQVLAAAGEGQGPVVPKVAPDTYTMNLFLSGRYTISAQTFCRTGAKAPIVSSAVTVDGANISISSIDIGFDQGECSPK